MKTVGIFEAKNRLSELVAQAESGEVIVLTRNGHPVAQIGPVAFDHERAREAMAFLRSRKLNIKRDEIQSFIDAGRKF